MTLLTEKKIESVEMPENLAVSMRVMKQRMECEMRGCDFNIVHYAFGGSPFPVPDAVQKRLAESAALGEYGPAEGMEPLRGEIAGFWKRHFGIEVDPARIVVTPGSKWAIYLALAMLSGPVVLSACVWLVKRSIWCKETFEIGFSRGATRRMMELWPQFLRLIYLRPIYGALET